MTMATYAVDGTKAGTVLQAGAGTLVSVQMTTAPTGRSEQAFDPHDSIPVAGFISLVGMKQAVALHGASFGSLMCSACPPGASYSVVTT
jgi:hypothetical protein